MRVKSLIILKVLRFYKKHSVNAVLYFVTHNLAFTSSDISEITR